MKKLTSLLAIASLAVALTSAAALACEKTCGASKTTATATSANATNVSAKSACSASKADGTTTTAAAHNCKPGDCALSSGKYAVAVMNVDGMTCGGCENKLTLAFEKTDGVIWVAAVSHSDGVAKVIFDKSITKSDDMVRLVNESGFKAEIMPAVAITNVDAKSDAKAACTPAQKAACAAAGKATCSAEHKAACEKSGKACCTSKDGKGATTTSASVTTASAGTCKDTSSECSKLTAAERAGFCDKYCKTETKESKKDI